MAKKGGSAVYRVTEVIGTSSQSWEDAARNAVKTAGVSVSLAIGDNPGSATLSGGGPVL